MDAVGSKGLFVKPADRLAAQVAVAKGPPTSVAAVGVTQNGVGNGNTFVLNLGINAMMMSICFLLFSIGRQHYKRVYSGNVYTGSVPCQPSTSFLGWIHDSMS